jgi:hypothetical protein
MIMTYTILKLQPDNKLKIKIKVFAPQRKNLHNYYLDEQEISHTTGTG